MASDFCTQLFVEDADKRQPRPRPWQGDRLWVRFMTDPYPSSAGQMMLNCRQYIMDCAAEWEKAANVKFLWCWSEIFHDNIMHTDIRITFESNNTFCYVGTEATMLGQETATMNFGWVPERFEGSDQRLRQMVLHLFGHALGMTHYRKNNNQPAIAWNTDWLEGYYLRNYSWVPKEIKSWVCDAYNPETQRDLQPADENTIMLHAYPKEATNDGSSSSWPTSLSVFDKFVIGSWYAGNRWTDKYGTYSLDDTKKLRPLSKQNWGYIKYATPFPTWVGAQIMTGINQMDQDCDNDLSLEVRAEDTDGHSFRDGFTAHLDSNDSMRHAGLSWLALPNNPNPADPVFWTGEVHIQSRDFKDPKGLTQTITFPQPFTAPPAVIVWLRKINFGRKASPSYEVKVLGGGVDEDPIPLNSFQLHADWHDGNFKDATVCWLAYNKTKMLESGCAPVTNVKSTNTGHVAFTKHFSTVPKVLVGFSSLSLSAVHWWTLKTFVDRVKKEGFDWHVEGPTMKGATVNWIAFL